MAEYDNIYPEYNFKSNKGYGTQMHIKSLLKYGPCEIHRKTFIKKILDQGRLFK
jgi:ribonuclease HII